MHLFLQLGREKNICRSSTISTGSPSRRSSAPATKTWQGKGIIYFFNFFSPGRDKEEIKKKCPVKQNHKSPIHPDFCFCIIDAHARVTTLIGVHAKVVSHRVASRIRRAVGQGGGQGFAHGYPKIWRGGGARHSLGDAGAQPQLEPDQAPVQGHEELHSQPQQAEFRHPG